MGVSPPGGLSVVILLSCFQACHLSRPRLDISNNIKLWPTNLQQIHQSWTKAGIAEVWWGPIFLLLKSDSFLDFCIFYPISSGHVFDKAFLILSSFPREIRRSGWVCHQSFSWRKTWLRRTAGCTTCILLICLSPDFDDQHHVLLLWIWNARMKGVDSKEGFLWSFHVCQWVFK